MESLIDTPQLSLTKDQVITLSQAGILDSLCKRIFDDTTEGRLMLCGFLRFLIATALAQAVDFLYRKIWYLSQMRHLHPQFPNTYCLQWRLSSCRPPYRHTASSLSSSLVFRLGNCKNSRGCFIIKTGQRCDDSFIVWKTDFSTHQAIFQQSA